MFYQTLMETVAAMAVALYSSVDKSIAAICDYSFNSILPYTVGLVIGLGVLRMLFHGDLVRGIRQLIAIAMPLFVVVWLVNPAGPDGCRIVGIKNDILALRAKIGGLVAPDFAGPPETLMRKTVERMDSINHSFQDKALRAMSPNYSAHLEKQNEQASK